VPASDATSIAVIGLGYIGLPTAAALAAQGRTVIGVDTDCGKVEAINRGEVPFVEPDLAIAVKGAVAQGSLRAQPQLPVAGTYIIAVPTPFKDGHEADLGYVRAAVDALAPTLRPGALVILESTSPPGTTRQVSEWLAELRPDLRLPHDATQEPDVHVAHCPERVLPGRIMIEIVTNDRVVGGITPACAERAAELYRSFCKGDIVLTDAATAEMSKLAENAYRDVNIAFANELSLIADRLGMDVWDVIAMANRHPRVNILSPGPGVGGHCIAVDPWFIVSSAPDEARLIRAAREVNDGKPDHVVAQAVEYARELPAPTIAALGLSYKADIDDLRESPALEIVARLADALPAASVIAVEPNITALPASLGARDNITLGSLPAAVAAADIVLVLVDHTPFASLERSLLAGKAVIDTRGLWR
jgi:UDP-N-acetyl-D-mannosaminuronic acid dehydrogenase